MVNTRPRRHDVLMSFLLPARLRDDWAALAKERSAAEGKAVSGARLLRAVMEQELTRWAQLKKAR